MLHATRNPKGQSDDRVSGDPQIRWQAAELPVITYNRKRQGRRAAGPQGRRAAGLKGKRSCAPLVGGVSSQHGACAILTKETEP